METTTLLYNKKNIRRQFNLVNQSFLSDWQILYWRMLLYFTCIGKNLAVFNLVDFLIRQTAKINSTPNFHLILYIPNS